MGHISLILGLVPDICLIRTFSQPKKLWLD
jgi:hypothetical protein